MVGNDDSRSARLGGLDGSFDAHDALDDERHVREGDDFFHFFHRFAASRRHKFFKEGKASCIYVHSNRKGSRSLDKVHFFPDHLHVPRFHRRNAHTLAVLDGVRGPAHDFRVHAVARKSKDT